MKLERRYRILYIQKPTGGGSTTGLYDLVRGLDRRIYKPVVLFYRPSFYGKHFEALGAKVIVLNDNTQQAISTKKKSRDIAAGLSVYSRWLGNAYRLAKQAYLLIRRDLPIARRVARLMKDESIDLVHHNTHLLDNRATIIAARLANLPQVCHVRMLIGFSMIERFLARFIDSFIYMSRAIERRYQELGIAVDHGQIIYDGFDTELSKQINCQQIKEIRKEFEVTDQDFLISNIGRIDTWKGQDDFLEAIAQVVQGHPNVKALIVGSYDPARLNCQIYYEKLQRMVAQLQLSDYVTFTGFRSDIAQIMAASDIIVHSSSEPEPFGRVIVEAMLVGKPVIATSAGGVLDIVEDKASGLLVPPKKPERMAQAIEWLLNNREQAEKMGAYAQQNAKARFSVEQHTTAVQQLYQKILINK